MSTRHLPTSWAEHVSDEGWLSWKRVDRAPACGSTKGTSIKRPDDGGKVNCPDCKPYVWDCGCIAHHTKPGGTGVYCITEQNGYCNFECPHDEEAYEERLAELTAQGIDYIVAVRQAEQEVEERREASIAARRTTTENGALA